MPKPPSQLRDFKSLVKIVADLRGPNGCPWDKEQTHQSLTQYAIEETAELVEAIEKNNPQLVCEELGDVLFQVLLHAQLANEKGLFDIHDVIAAVNEKMIRRHPHVFGDVEVQNSDEVLQNWEQIKLKENNSSKQKLSFNLPKSLPSLQAAHKIGQKTAKVKFDWPNSKAVWLKVEEEYKELKSALKNRNKKAWEHELGDLLFSLSQLARHLNLEAEKALRIGNRRFEKRFFRMQILAEEMGLKWPKINNKTKESLWQKTKKILEDS